MKTELEMEKLLRNTGARTPSRVDVAINAQIKEDFSAGRLVGINMDRFREFWARVVHRVA